MARLYQEIARGQSPAVVRALRADALRLLGSVRDVRILDVRCGTGGFARRLSEDGGQVLGIDASEETIGEARADAAVVDGDAGVAPEFRVADPADRDALPEGTFDVVTWLDLEHPPTGLRDLVRKVRRGGRLLLAAPHPYASDKAGGQPLESLLGWLRGAGLRVVDVAEPQSRARDYLLILAERPARRRRR